MKSPSHCQPHEREWSIKPVSPQKELPGCFVASITLFAPLGCQKSFKDSCSVKTLTLHRYITDFTGVFRN